MTWTAETSRGFESDKIAALAVPYIQGRWLDLGCGARKVWPSAIGIDNGGVYGRGGADMAGDIADLSMFSDASMDAVFSSHALEDFPLDRVAYVLKEWLRVLKIGGHLVLYVPSGNLYPHIGEEGANPAHQWEPMPGDIEGILKAIVLPGHPGARSSIMGPFSEPEYGLELIESEERSDTNEYSLFVVVRKTAAHGGLRNWTENLWQRNPGGKKRALVVRFGAIGDQIQTSSILPGLKKQGYHITYCTTPRGQQVVRHDPHVDDWWIQETDFVPNEQLGPYFESVLTRFDLFVNLCESIEGTLLALPNRVQHTYPYETRRRLMGTVNYLERMHDIAGVPHIWAPKFYPTIEELMWAGKWLEQNTNGMPVLVWAITGSSAHKIYPFIHIVLRWLLEQSPCHVVLTGDNGISKGLQEGIIKCLVEDGADVSRVHAMAGEWTVRESLTLAKQADCVVGPETGLLNAVAMEPMPKVLYLSHSSRENLTRDWVNTQTLAPPAGSVSCFPCHQLHADWTYCHQDAETKAAACATAIKPEVVFEAVAMAFGAVKTRVAEAAD